ncbi:MAG: hypothetical protein N3A66_06230, partial [Planctomycetota bacterium]|nr:hypothetical protein [Planctomycetota bacterium]
MPDLCMIASDKAPAPARVRRWFWWFAAPIALALGLILAAPSLFSSAPGVNILLRYINAGLSGKISIDEMSLSWFGSQRIAGLALTDPQGEKVIEVASITLPQTRLAQLLINRSEIGVVRLEGLNAHIVQYGDGTNNLARALRGPGAAAKQNSTPGLPAGLRIKIEVINGQATFTMPGLAPLQANDVNAALEMRGLQQLAMSLTARLQQAAESGEVALQAKAIDLFGADGALQIDKAEWEADAVLRHFPTPAIDSLTGQGSAATALLGNMFDVTLKAARLPAAGAAAIALGLQVQAPNLTATFSGEFANGLLVISPGGSLRAAITPEFVAAIGKAYPPLANLLGKRSLARPATIALTLERTAVPLAKFNAGEIQTGIEMSLDRLALSGDANWSGFELRDAKIKMRAPALGQRLQA